MTNQIFSGLLIRNAVMSNISSSTIAFIWSETGLINLCLRKYKAGLCDVLLFSSKGTILAEYMSADFEEISDSNLLLIKLKIGEKFWIFCFCWWQVWFVQSNFSKRIFSICMKIFFCKKWLKRQFFFMVRWEQIG